MTTDATAEKKPIWLSIEEKIQGVSDQDFTGNTEGTIQRLAGELDNEGHNVSCHGGNMFQLRWAVESRMKVGRALMKDLDEAISALTLDNLADPYTVTTNLIKDLGQAWPKIKDAARKPDILALVEKTKLDLQVKKAKSLSADQGIRFLIEETVDAAVIIERLSITKEKYDEIDTLIKKELAEKERVKSLLDAVTSKTNDEKVKHLITNDVSDELIIEIGGFNQGDLDNAKQALEAELKEKQRMAEEEAERKRKEAEGPSLDTIPADKMLDYIESIRDILDICDKEDEIRVMCGQSNVPKCLIDIAISDPDKLDELEEQAEG